MSTIPFLDLKAQYAPIREQIRQEIDAVCDAQWFILGPKVKKFEQAVAAYSGTRAACGVSSGSDALIISLMAENIGPGDEVITSPFTFFATVGAICRVGTKPVFVDIDPRTFNLDPSRIEAAISPRTRAIIPIHLFGQCADIDPILALAKKHQLIVIEDAAQAIGAAYRGKCAGSMGRYGCLSFFPSKNLGGFGDGGMVLTDSNERCDHLYHLRNHGAEPKYYHQFIGGNFRLDALQAAILMVKLQYLDQWTAARQRNAAHYHELFTDAGLLDNGQVRLPQVAEFTSRHVYNQFSIRLPAERRQMVWDHLKAVGIGCDVYYPVPLHLQECFSSLGYAVGDFPHSETAAAEVLAIPISPELTPTQQKTVVQEIGLALKGAV